MPAFWHDKSRVHRLAAFYLPQLIVTANYQHTLNNSLLPFFFESVIIYINQGRLNRSYFMIFEKILAVQNYGASGTLLIQSLLDSHPQIISLPALNGQRLLYFWKNYSHLNKEQMLAQFIQEYDYWFDPKQDSSDLGLTNLGPNKDEKASVDKSTFIRNVYELWSQYQPLDCKKFISSVYSAYNACLNRSFSPDAWLLYPIHSLPKERALDLVQHFSKVYVLHMHRDPIQNIGSGAKHINYHPHWQYKYLLHCTTSQILDDFVIHVAEYHVHGLYPYFHDSVDGSLQSRSVRLEDVHKHPKETLTHICQWLNIQWNDCLLQSTFDNKTWHNRVESVKQTGIGLQVISQKHNEVLSYFDKYRLQILAMPILMHLGYRKKLPFLYKMKKLILPFLLLFPFKMELNFKRYRTQIKKLNAIKDVNELKKEREILSSKYGHKFLNSKLFNVFLIISYNLKNYINCRKFLLKRLHAQYDTNAIVRPLIEDCI